MQWKKPILKFNLSHFFYRWHLVLKTVGLEYIGPILDGKEIDSSKNSKYNEHLCCSEFLPVRFLCYKSTDILYPPGIPECTKKLQIFLFIFWIFPKKDSPAIKYKSTLPFKTDIYALYTDSASLLCFKKLSWLFWLLFSFVCFLIGSQA